MEAATNVGYALIAGYSLRQGTPQLRNAVIELMTCVKELISSDNHKLIFMLIPRKLRQFIPLRYWPRKYSFELYMGVI